MGRMGRLGRMGRRQWDNGTYKFEGNMLRCAPALPHYRRLTDYPLRNFKQKKTFACLTQMGVGNKVYATG